jgi:hypothetical protein
MEHELSDFTKLVLARLETNPDEFQLGGRWDTLVRGLEARAFGDTESKYARVLWALSEHERDVVFEAYRKAYLARLHKDMLKNIVSGNDLGPSPEQTFQAGLGKQASQGVLRGASPSTLISDHIYDANRYAFASDSSITANVAATSTLQLGDTKLTEGDVKKLKKILVTHTDHASRDAA